MKQYFEDMKPLGRALQGNEKKAGESNVREISGVLGRGAVGKELIHHLIHALPAFGCLQLRSVEHMTVNIYGVADGFGLDDKFKAVGQIENNRLQCGRGDGESF